MSVILSRQLLRFKTSDAHSALYRGSRIPYVKTHPEHICKQPMKRLITKTKGSLTVDEFDAILDYALKEYVSRCITSVDWYAPQHEDWDMAFTHLMNWMQHPLLRLAAFVFVAVERITMVYLHKNSVIQVPSDVDVLVVTFQKDTSDDDETNKFAEKVRKLLAFGFLTYFNQNTTGNALDSFMSKYGVLMEGKRLTFKTENAIDAALYYTEMFARTHAVLSRLSGFTTGRYTASNITTQTLQ